MNIKRLIATGAGAALLLSATAIPALANFDDFTLIKNKAWVKNIVITKADTGGNSINAGDDVKYGSITTGGAEAGALVDNVVNTNQLDCGCVNNHDDSGLIIKNKAGVKNVVITKADTGGNSINAWDDVKGGSIDTGMAGAGSIVTNVVNTNIIGGSEE